MIDRRTLLLGISAAAALPSSRPAHAQQREKPVIGFLGPALRMRQHWLAAFRKGLGSEGFVDGENATIEYRDAGDKDELLPELAAGLVRSKVTVIAVTGPPAALAAKRATQSIPIVFISGVDPVEIGLVSSLGRPGGNLTGLFLQSSELAAKRLELLREMVPGLKRVALLVNQANPVTAEPTVRDISAAVQTLGLEYRLFSVSESGAFEAALESMASWKAGALFIGPDPVFTTERAKLVSLAARHKLPASYFQRDHVEAGGLMSYGPDFANSNRLAGIYVGRILKGAKPADLPVMQPTRFELVINKKVADALGLAIPPLLQAQADEVLE